MKCAYFRSVLSIKFLKEIEMQYPLYLAYLPYNFRYG